MRIFWCSSLSPPFVREFHFSFPHWVPHQFPHCEALGGAKTGEIFTCFCTAFVHKQVQICTCSGTCTRRGANLHQKRCKFALEMERKCTKTRANLHWKEVFFAPQKPQICTSRRKRLHQKKGDFASKRVYFCTEKKNQIIAPGLRLNLPQLVHPRVRES